MWKYLKAAFLVGVDVPGLGRLPVNALVVAAAAIFGVVEPSVWLAGGGLEVAFLASLTFSPRFQTLVEGKQLQAGRGREAGAIATQVQALVAALPPELHLRMTELRRSAARVLEIYRSLGFDAATTETTRESLDRLEWIFLKLLVARNHLEHELSQTTLPEVETRIAKLAAEAALVGEQAAGLVRSREATLEILRRRAENLRSRDRLLAENASDLERVEAQVELMRENAAIHGKPYAVDMEIELASDLAAPDLFGAQAGLVHSLERGRG